MISSLKWIGKCHPRVSRFQQPGAANGTMIIIIVVRMLLFLAPNFNTEAPGIGKIRSLVPLSSFLALLFFPDTKVSGGTASAGPGTTMDEPQSSKYLNWDECSVNQEKNVSLLFDRLFWRSQYGALVHQYFTMWRNPRNVYLQIFIYLN